MMGFGFLFKVDETCIPLHIHERRVRESDDDQLSVASELTASESVDGEEEILVDDDLEQGVSLLNTEQSMTRCNF